MPCDYSSALYLLLFSCHLLGSPFLSSSFFFLAHTLPLLFLFSYALLSYNSLNQKGVPQDGGEWQCHECLSGSKAMPGDVVWVKVCTGLRGAGEEGQRQGGLWVCACYTLDAWSNCSCVRIKDGSRRRVCRGIGWYSALTLALAWLSLHSSHTLSRSLAAAVLPPPFLAGGNPRVRQLPRQPRARVPR